MRRLGLALLLGLLGTACNDSSAPLDTTPTAIFQLSPLDDPSLLPDDFYSLPFPNDIRRNADGMVDLSTFPRGIRQMVDEYVDYFDGKLDGFGTQSGVFFRFSAPLDPATLPATGQDSITDDAHAFIVDVTATSPTYGKKHPVYSHFVEARGDFIGPNWLTLVPAFGVPLRQKTTYAAIVLNSVHPKAGGLYRVSPVLQKALDESTIAAYQPLRDWLATQPTLKDRIINAAVFTTMDATSLMFRLREATYKKAPAPVAANLVYDEKGSSGKAYNLYTGTYDSPNFQQGAVPYLMSGGNIIDDTDGLPAISRTETLRFALSVPKGDTPPEGWPIVLYAHGTGGDYKSFISNGAAQKAADVQDADGNTIAKLAMISIDQVLHGPRDPTMSKPTVTFFNFQNIAAGVDNAKQGAADDFQLLRLAKAMNDPAPTTNQLLKFNPNQLYFKGHSQGGLTGPLFCAAEPEIKAAIFSGAGGNLVISMLNKTQPPPAIIDIVSLFVDPPIDEYHPLLNLVQMFLESSDPTNYGALFFKEPPSGFAPKPIFQSLGITDHYTPIPTIKVFAKSMGVQPIAPMLEPIADLDLAGLSWGSAPTQQNVANNLATGVLLEYTQKAGSDGHFVIEENDDAVKQSNRFLATHVKSGIATLTTP